MLNKIDFDRLEAKIDQLLKNDLAKMCAQATETDDDFWAHELDGAIEATRKLLGEK